MGGNEKKRLLWIIASLWGALCIMVLFSLWGSGSARSVEGVEEKMLGDKKIMMSADTAFYYLDKMTKDYADAYTIAVTAQQRQGSLNKALTNINIAIVKIESEYVEDTSPARELLELAETLKTAIYFDQERDYSARNQSVEKAFQQISNISKKYCNGEMPENIMYLILKSGSGG